jgi:hypothetical protein
MDGTPAPRVRSPRLRLSGLVRAVITVDQGHVVSATAFFAAHNQQDTAAAATNSSLAIPTAATSQSDVGAELCTVMTATSTTSESAADAAVRTPSLLESSSPQRADRCVSWPHSPSAQGSAEWACTAPPLPYLALLATTAALWPAQPTRLSNSAPSCRSHSCLHFGGCFVC